MLHHFSCKNQVFIDTSERIKVLSSFIIGYNGVKTTTSMITPVTSNLKIKFFCPTCNVSVSLDGIRGICANCGKTVELSHLYRVNKVSGEYCDSCSKLLFPAVSKKTVLSIVSNDINK